MINVAIDGPAGAGKSTVARGAAKQLGYIYVDTGALYRTVALSAVRCGALGDSEKIENMLKNITVNLAFDDSGAQCVYLNGEDVSSLIRTPDISMAASDVSKIPAVRAFLLGLQRDIAENNNVIMDGRDMNARDYQDSHREIAPLKPAEDSYIADTSGKSLPQSIEMIVSVIKEKTNGEV